MYTATPGSANMPQNQLDIMLSIHCTIADLLQTSYNAMGENLRKSDIRTLLAVVSLRWSAEKSNWLRVQATWGISGPSLGHAMKK
jgi:hypothetical protein